MVRWLEAEALLVAAVAAVAAINLATIPSHLSQDGWLALVAGRYVANHGVPSSDTLNVLTHGLRWIDQQWLAQLIVYRLAQVGGLFLYGVSYVALTTAAFGLAIMAARALAGSQRTIFLVLLPSALLYLAGSFAIRTQAFAYPFFALTLWLLAQDARTPARRVYLVIPLLVVWGNLHGSVTLGVGLAVLYGISRLVTDIRSGGLKSIQRRTAIFLVVPPLCLLATPYGFAILAYFRGTLLNPAFGRLVTEWKPVTSITVLAVPCIALAEVTIWLLGRSGRRTPLFDQLALLVVAAAAILAIRNVTWFGLTALMLLPPCVATISAEGPPAPRRRRLNLTIGWVSLFTVAALSLAAAFHSSSWFEQSYDKRTLSSVESLVKQHPQARIFAALRFSDWLLWHDPSLAGKLAYDTRLELLSRRQLEALAALGSPRGRGQLNLLAGFKVLVLDRTSGSMEQLVAQTRARVVSRNRDALIALAS